MKDNVNETKDSKLRRIGGLCSLKTLLVSPLNSVIWSASNSDYTILPNDYYKKEKNVPLTSHNITIS